MSVAVFPADSFAAARPHLRAPFPAALVRGRILEVPEDPRAPCLVGLHVTREVVIDRLDLVCGENWEPPRFETLREELRGEQEWHVKLRAYLVLFAKTRFSTGSGTGVDRELVEFAAEAQALKRAAGMFGVGHSLAAAGRIWMCRGESEQQLRTGSDGQPYLDQASEAYIRLRYEVWLAETGIALYGQPLGDTLPEALLSPLASASEAEPPPAGLLASVPNARPTVPTRPALEASAERRSSRAGKRQPTRQDPRARCCSEQLHAELHSLLGQPPDRPLPAEQQQTLEQWLDVLAAKHLDDRTALIAVNIAIERSETQPEAQRRFTNWLANHVQEGYSLDAQPAIGRDEEGPSSPLASEPTRESNAASSVDGATSPTASAPDTASSLGTSEGALAALERQLDDCQYPAELVDAILALATGTTGAPVANWETLPAARITEVAGLLGCAGQLDWSSARLLAEVQRSEQESQFRTAAGRFTAFASRLRRAAEIHAHEQARAAA